MGARCGCDAGGIRGRDKDEEEEGRDGCRGRLDWLDGAKSGGRSGST